MAMSEDGYVVLESLTEETSPWDGVSRPKIVQGHYVAEVVDVMQEVSAGAKTTGANMYTHTLRMVAGWDTDAEKEIETDQAGLEGLQRYIDAPKTIGRYLHFLNVIGNPPDNDRGIRPGASIGRRFIVEVTHTPPSKVQDPATGEEREIVYSNFSNERPLPAPKQAAKPAGKPAPTPAAAAQKGNASKSGGASARR